VLILALRSMHWSMASISKCWSYSQQLQELKLIAEADEDRDPR
jgi:hypothetical protein